MRPVTLRWYSTCNLDVHVSIQQQILRLQVPVDDVAVVTILHRRQDLPELPPGLELTQTAVLRQVVCSQTVEKGDVSCLKYKKIICCMTVQVFLTPSLNYITLYSCKECICANISFH